MLTLELARRMGVPKRFREMSSLGSWEGPIPEAAARWLEARSPEALVLMGPTGRGKTHLGTALLVHRAQLLDRAEEINGYDSNGYGRWVSARGFLEQLRAEIGQSGDGSYMGIYVGTPLLLLDDMGAEVLTGERGEWRRDRIAHVLAERFDQMRPTIITTNLHPEDLHAIDARLASRLSAFQVVLAGEKDWRTGAP